MGAAGNAEGEHSADEPYQKKRAVILSDTRVFRESLSSSLTRCGAVEVVSMGGAADAEEQIRDFLPTIILLDAALSDALSLPKLAKSIIPHIIIIVFAASDSDLAFLEWAETGISGYLDQHDSLDEVRASIASATRGELVCSPLRTALLLGRVAILSAHRTVGKSLDLLTARENKVMGLLAEGLPNKLIARRMGITEATVKNHVHSILEKTGTHTRGEAAARYRVQKRIAVGSTQAHCPDQTTDESDAWQVPKLQNHTPPTVKTLEISENGRLIHNRMMHQIGYAIKKVVEPN